MRENYGPNYPTPEAESKALRAERRTGWFDAWAFALLLICLLAPAFYVVPHVG